MLKDEFKKYVTELEQFIEASIARHKPVAYGTPGTLSFVKEYLTEKYPNSLIACGEEVTNKANDLLIEVDKQDEGQAEILKEKFVQLIKSVQGKFKQAYWRD